MSKKIFAVFLALFMLLQIPAVVDALDDFGIETTAEAATYKLKKPVISKLTNVSGGVKVQWGKVSGAANYRVMYKTSSTGSWKTAGTTTSTSYTFKNVSSGKTYYFTVRCVSKSGKTATSAYDKTGEKIKYIAKPVIKSLSNTSSGVKITWGKVAGAAKYRVLLKTSSGWKTVADTTSTSYTYKTTNSGKKYTFSVRCVSATGKSTTSAYDTTGKSIQFIEKPKLKTLTSTENGVKLTWTPCEGATRYRVLLKTDSGWKKVKDTTKSGYTYTDLTAYNEYTLTVRCIDDDGNYISYYDTKGMTVKYAYPQVLYQLNEKYIVNEGASQTLNFYISDWQATYRWYFKDADEDEFHRSTAFTGPNYSVDMSDDVNGRQVYCVATDSNGIKVKSAVTTLWQTSPYSISYLGDGTISITGYNAFNGTKKSLTVPSRIYGRKVSTIGASAFSINYLTGITLPKTVTTIERNAFSGARSLTKVTLPDSLRTIGENAFGHCENLTAIKLPSGLTTIGDQAFRYVPLTTITIPASVTSIGEEAFYNCDSLTEVRFASGSRLTELGPRAFFDSGLTTIKLPASLKSIGSNVFAQCESLSSVTLPSGLKSIDTEAFRFCKSLKSIKLPSGLTSIGASAFIYCGLTSIDIPDSVTSVGASAFYLCESMTSASLSAGMTEIPSHMFYGASLRTIDIPDSITSIGDHAFDGCSLSSIDYPAGLKKIGDDAFYGNYFSNGDLPEGLQSIGDGAFRYCSNLSSVYLPDSLTFIGENAFSDITSFVCGAGTVGEAWCIGNNCTYTLK